MISPNLGDYDINVLVALGNRTDDVFIHSQIKVLIVKKILELDYSMFFLINKFMISQKILKEAYAEVITMKMKDNNYYIENSIMDSILKLASLDALMYYGADSNSLEFSRKCKEEFDSRAKEIEDKVELNRKRNLNKTRSKGVVYRKKER